MNRILIPLFLLLGSFLYSWFWHNHRQPYCNPTELVAIEETLGPAVTDTTQIASEPALTAVEQLLFEPLDLYFKAGKSNFERDANITNWLETAKKYLEANPTAKLSVIGYSDSEGDDATNLSLSERRAGIVKNLLVRDGFAAASLETSGKGEAEPKASNDTEEGKSMNRRVSITLMK